VAASDDARRQGLIKLAKVAMKLATICIVESILNDY
jgi:hypothetical protein